MTRADSDEQRSGGGSITWRFDIPLLTSRFMLWDFARVILISLAIMYVLVAFTGWLVDGEFVWLPPVVLLVGGGVVLGLFFIAALLLGNRSGARFTVSPEGVLYEAEERERRMNRLVAVAGAVAGSATTAGAGLLASSREELLVPWDEIRRVVTYPRQRVISLRNSWRVVLRLHVPRELYPQVAAAVDQYWRETQPLSVAATPPARAGRDALHYAGWASAVAVCAVAAQVWPWTDSEFAARIGVVGAAATALAVLTEVVGRRLWGVLALPLLLWHAVAIGISALDTIDGVRETAYVAGLDPGLLAVSSAGLTGLVAIAAWRAFGPEGTEAAGD